MKRLPDVLKMTVETNVVDGFELKNLLCSLCLCVLLDAPIAQT